MGTIWKLLLHKIYGQQSWAKIKSRQGLKPQSIHGAIQAMEDNFEVTNKNVFVIIYIIMGKMKKKKRWVPWVAMITWKWLSWVRLSIWSTLMFLLSYILWFEKTHIMILSNHFSIYMLKYRSTYKMSHIWISL